MKKIFNRHNIPNADAVMFFDYPPNQEIFDEILEKTSAKHIHFMHYEVKNVDEKEF